MCCCCVVVLLLLMAAWRFSQPRAIREVVREAVREVPVERIVEKKVYVPKVVVKEVRVPTAGRPPGPPPMREACRALSRWAITRQDEFVCPAPHAAMSGAMPEVSFYTLLLHGATDRELNFRHNQRTLDSMQMLPAVNGGDATALRQAFADAQLRLPGGPFPSSLGQIALQLTRVQALRRQLVQGVRWAAYLQDDVLIGAAFSERVTRLAQLLQARAGASHPSLSHARLGTWGEVYLVPLEGARAILCRYCQSGILHNDDNQWRLVSGAQCRADARGGWSRPGSNASRLYDYRLAARANTGVLRALQLRENASAEVTLEALRELGEDSPVQPAWCRRVGPECRWAAPLDRVSREAWKQTIGSRCLKLQERRQHRNQSES